VKAEEAYQSAMVKSKKDLESLESEVANAVNTKREIKEGIKELGKSIRELLNNAAILGLTRTPDATETRLQAIQYLQRKQQQQLEERNQRELQQESYLKAALEAIVKSQQDQQAMLLEDRSQFEEIRTAIDSVQSLLVVQEDKLTKLSDTALTSPRDKPTEDEKKGQQARHQPRSQERKTSATAKRPSAAPAKDKPDRGAEKKKEREKTGNLPASREENQGEWTKVEGKEIPLRNRQH